MYDDTFMRDFLPNRYTFMREFPDIDELGRVHLGGEVILDFREKSFLLSVSA